VRFGEYGPFVYGAAGAVAGGSGAEETMGGAWGGGGARPGSAGRERPLGPPRRLWWDRDGPAGLGSSLCCFPWVISRGILARRWGRSNSSHDVCVRPSAGRPAGNGGPDTGPRMAAPGHAPLSTGAWHFPERKLLQRIHPLACCGIAASERRNVVEYSRDARPGTDAMFLAC